MLLKITTRWIHYLCKLAKHKVQKKFSKNSVFKPHETAKYIRKYFQVHRLHHVANFTNYDSKGFPLIPSALSSTRNESVNDTVYVGRNSVVKKRLGTKLIIENKRRHVFTILYLFVMGLHLPYLPKSIPLLQCYFPFSHNTAECGWKVFYWRKESGRICSPSLVALLLSSEEIVIESGPSNQSRPIPWVSDGRSMRKRRSAGVK